MLKRLIVILAAALAPGFAAAQGPPIDMGNRPLFSASSHPAAPDYSNPDTWAALPGRKDAADLVPPGVRTGDRQAVSAVDVFYINPTTDSSKAYWNAAWDDAKVNAWTDLSVVSRQAAAFNAAGRVYAPRYRQGASGASNFKDASARAAFALAYSDVRRSFDYYLTHYNKGRPFILVGHSQGGFHLNRLLEEVIDGKPLQNRMVAAYSLGIGQPLGAVAVRYKTIKICDKPAQTRCLISWNAYLGGSDTKAYQASSLEYAATMFGPVENKQLLCINPLTFDTSKPKAEAAANLGALATDPTPGPLPRLVPGATGAECVDGVVMVDPAVSDTLKIKALPGGSMHFHDLSLFYENVRENAVLRAKAFVRKR